MLLHSSSSSVHAGYTAAAVNHPALNGYMTGMPIMTVGATQGVPYTSNDVGLNMSMPLAASADPLQSVPSPIGYNTTVPFTFGRLL